MGAEEVFPGPWTNAFPNRRKVLLVRFPVVTRGNNAERTAQSASCAATKNTMCSGKFSRSSCKAGIWLELANYSAGVPRDVRATDEYMDSNPFRILVCWFIKDIVIRFFNRGLVTIRTKIGRRELDVGSIIADTVGERAADTSVEAADVTQKCDTPNRIVGDETRIATEDCIMSKKDIPDVHCIPQSLYRPQKDILLKLLFAFFGQSMFPIMSQLWLVRNTGNANFLYFMQLLYHMALTLALLQFVGCVKRRLV